MAGTKWGVGQTVGFVMVCFIVGQEFLLEAEKAEAYAG